MKKTLPYDELRSREVPAALDARILGYAARRGGVRALRRRWFRTGILAAAALVMVAGVLFWSFGTPEAASRGNRTELLALGDFSRLDQTGYNLSFELNSGREFALNTR